jgi:hypothetical protein
MVLIIPYESAANMYHESERRNNRHFQKVVKRLGG